MIFCVQNESSSLSLSPMTQIVNTSSEDAADKSAARNDSNDTSAPSVTTTTITNSPAQNETLIKLPDPPPPPTPLPPTSNSPPTAKEPPPPPILEPICSDSSPNVDDGLTSLSWLQNLNMCMTRLGATTPLTPPASPASQVCSSLGSFHHHHHHHHRYHQNYHPHVHGSVRSGSMKGLPISYKHSNHHHPHHLSSSSPSSSGNGSSSSSTSSSNTTGRSERSSRSAGHSSSSSSSTSTKNKRTLPRPEEMIDYKINGTDKPPYSYATLICMAMKANQNKMTLAAIYRWIKENFLYYKNAEPSWQNSIRHNLSLNKCFLKVPRTKEEPGKGGFWRLDPEYAETLVDGVFKKRRPSQRNNPTNGTILKRKSRKKDIQSDEVSIDEKAQSSSQNDVIKTIITVHPMKSYEPLLIHDTPPSSAESCTFIENGGETAELVSAVNSIDNLSTSQCNEGPFSQYTIHTGDHSSYGEETGITLNGIGDASMVSTEVPNDDNHHHLFSQENGGDICWNAILTDADLELLSSTSFPGRIVHTTVNGSDLDTSVSSNQLTPLSNPTDSSSEGSGVNNTGSTLHLVDPPTVHVMDATSSSLPSAASLFRQAADVVGSNSGANTNRNSSTSVIGGTVCSSSGGGGNGSSLNRLLASNHTTATTSTSIAAGSVTSTTVSSILNGRIPILTSGNNGICDIISANHNVVTCVNPDPSNVNNSTDWWTPFASLQHSLSDQSLASPDMISIQAIDGNHSDLMSSPIILAPVSSTSNANVNDDGRNNNSHNYVVDRSTSSLASCQTSFSSHHSNSIPNHGNRGQHDCIQISDGLMDSKIESDSNPFDPQSNLQPWIECKAALEAAAFDLEQFSVLENCSDF